MKQLLTVISLIAILSCATQEAPKIYKKGIYIGHTGLLLEFDSLDQISKVLDTLVAGTYMYDLEETASYPGVYPVRKVMKDSVIGWVPNQWFVPKGRGAVVIANSPIFPEVGSQPDGMLNSFSIVAVDSVDGEWIRARGQSGNGFIQAANVSYDKSDIEIARMLLGMDSMNWMDQEKKLKEVRELAELKASEVLKGRLDQSLAIMAKNRKNNFWQQGLYFPEHLEYSEWYWNDVDSMAQNTMVYSSEDNSYQLDAAEIKGRNFRQGTSSLLFMLLKMNEGKYDMDPEIYNTWSEELNDKVIVQYEYSLGDVRKFFSTFTGTEPFLRYENQMLYWNPETIEWAIKNMIPYPSEMMQKIYSDQFRDFFRMYALGYEYLNPDPSSDIYLNHTNDYMSVFDGEDMVEGYYDGAHFLSQKYEHVTFLDDQGREYGNPDESIYPMLEPYHVLGFWLRRYKDNTNGVCWKGLKKVMMNYDNEWFTNNISEDLL